jgi:SNF2 family DNA or RNA helicase
VEIGSSPKITELLNIIEEIGDQPLIIWANFRWEIQKITQVLQDNYGFGCVETLYSETEDRDQAINNFKNGNSRFLVAHPRSASYGLTFVNCSVQVFFSLSYSFEDWDQCKGRTHRIGQAKTCVYIHLIARKTIDENILQVVQGKKETQDLITEFLNEGV